MSWKNTLLLELFNDVEKGVLIKMHVSKLLTFITVCMHAPLQENTQLK